MVVALKALSSSNQNKSKKLPKTDVKKFFRHHKTAKSRNFEQKKISKFCGKKVENELVKYFKISDSIGRKIKVRHLGLFLSKNWTFCKSSKTFGVTLRSICEQKV